MDSFIREQGQHRDWFIPKKQNTHRNKSIMSNASTTRWSRESSMSNATDFKEWNAKKHSRISSIQLKEKRKLNESMREKPRIGSFSKQLANKKMIDEMISLSIIKPEPIKVSDFLPGRPTKKLGLVSHPVKIKVNIQNHTSYSPIEKSHKYSHMNAQESIRNRLEFSHKGKSIDIFRK